MKIRFVLSLAAVMLSLLASPVISRNSQLMINRDGCGTEKLCLEEPPNCDPSEDSNCLFMSSDLVNSTNDSELLFELSGSSEGYIAMGLTMNASEGMTMLFACAQSDMDFFFRTARRNNTAPNDAPMLTDRNVTNIEGYVNGSSIRCQFKVHGLNFANMNYTVLLGNGSVTNNSLNNFNMLLTRGPLNLTDPTFGSRNPTTAAPQTTPTPPLMINRDGCGTEKLCLEEPTNCDPSEDSNCLFMSSDLVNSTNDSELLFELSGSSEGYIAMGLTMNASEGMTMLFACAQSNMDFFFRTARRNNTAANDAPMLTDRNVTNIEGYVNGSSIRCQFKVPGLNFTNMNYTVLLGNGSVTNNSLNNFNMLLTRGPLNLTDPTFGSRNPTTAAPQTTPTPPLMINRDGCGTEKLCLEEPTNCDPAENGRCLFTSFVVTSIMTRSGLNLFIELRGKSEGYIAVGLTPTASPETAMVFACAQNSSNNGSFFFRTLQRNNSDPNAALTPLIRNVTNTRGEVNDDVIRCVFTVPDVNSTRRRSAATTFSVIIGRGSINGDTFGPVNVSRSVESLNLQNPALGSNNNMTNATTQAPNTTMNDAVSSYPHALLLLSAIVLSIMLRN